MAKVASGETATTTPTAAEREGGENDTGFMLEPLEAKRAEMEIRAKRKRTVVDSNKEFSGQQIKSQFEDFKDLIQSKCFPPPTKKALMWREMAGCEHLYSYPTCTGISDLLVSLIKANYTTDIPGELPVDLLLELDKIDPNITKEDINSSKKHAGEIEKPGVPVANVDDTLNVAEGLQAGGQETVQNERFGEMEMKQPDADNILGPLDGIMGPLDGTVGPLDGIVDPLDSNTAALDGIVGPLDGNTATLDGIAGPLDGIADEEKAMASGMTDLFSPDENLPSVSSGDQLIDELSDEFEQRRWTKRTQQIILILERNLENKKSIPFSTLTAKCDRKQAASQFYTCLLLAKEGVIEVEQAEPYSAIHIQKGPKFA